MSVAHVAWIWPCSGYGVGQKKKKKKHLKAEFLLWCNGIGDILGVLGCGFDPGLAQWVKDPSLLQLGSDR